MSSPQQQQQAPPGPPYAPPIALPGGTPTPGIDVPISAVLLGIFVCGAVLNMTIFRRNRGRGHKFIPSAALFGFCMARTVAQVLRIALSYHQSNVSLLIAATVFFRAGVIIFFMLNLIFLQRIFRALHPGTGWERWASIPFSFLYFSVIGVLIMTICAAVYNFFTLDPHTQTQLQDVIKVAGVYMAFLAFLPIPGVILFLVLPGTQPVDHFGHGSMRTKIILIVFSSAMLTLGAGIRAAPSFLPRPADDPGWMNSRASFYCFNYVIEAMLVYLYALIRFDLRFHIPDGSSAPGHYSSGGPNGEKPRSDDETAVGVAASDEALKGDV